jgi:hypothetical protein
MHGVETDGKYRKWTYLSDLDIPSPNWIEGNDYLPIEPERFKRVLASLDITFEDFTFVDFGSGKGRALLLASGILARVASCCRRQHQALFLLDAEV